MPLEKTLTPTPDRAMWAIRSTRATGRPPLLLSRHPLRLQHRLPRRLRNRRPHRLLRQQLLRPQLQHPLRLQRRRRVLSWFASLCLPPTRQMSQEACASLAAGSISHLPLPTASRRLTILSTWSSRAFQQQGSIRWYILGGMEAKPRSSRTSHTTVLTMIRCPRALIRPPRRRRPEQRL